MHNSRAMTKPLSPQQIRDAELPRARRGFDEAATRGFLADAAGALSAVTRERDELQRQVDELSKHADQHPTDAQRIGDVLMAAHRAGEDLLARATDEAAQIRATAESERDDLFVRAQVHANALVAEATTAVEALRHEDEDLRRAIGVYRRELVLFLQTSLARLEEVESFGPAVPTPKELDGELLLRLPTE
jgi:cell division septum initiation protein DivIVA